MLAFYNIKDNSLVARTDDATFVSYDYTMRSFVVMEITTAEAVLIPAGEDMITANLNGKEGYPWIDLTVRVAVEAIDVTPLRYTYTESDEPIEDDEDEAVPVPV